MDKNWLIRTSQNQILGPVAKSKLLEFIQKGALGLTDEVASGNGYWFSLKEKDLVDKYLYGDIPQGYNPISEAISVLAINEDSEKTTSLNMAPPNRIPTLKTAVPENSVLPPSEDLEFPDITQVRSMPSLADLKGETSQAKNENKIPSNDDLEFPDITLITTVQSQTTFKKPSLFDSLGTSNENKFPEVIPLVENSEEVVLPQEDDLEFPDVESIKLAVANSTQKPLEETPVLIRAKGLKPQSESAVVKEKQETLQKREKPAEEDRKLLHDRKVKSSPRVAAKSLQRDPSRETAHRPHQEMTEPLKKRNDNYLFFILVILVLILLAVFFYFREILNKPLPV